MRRWINVLVVFVVLVFGGGLVTAGVARVQHAAARMTCCNNLKQFGLSLENYHDTYDCYPSATIPGKGVSYTPGGVPVVGLPADKRFSWLVTLVPYMDQSALVIDRTQAWDAEENLDPRIRVRVDDRGTTEEGSFGECPFFRCPLNPARAGPASPGLTHYVGIAGVGRDAADWSTGSPGIGLFGHYRETRRQDLVDGAAHTMTILETTVANGPWTTGGHPTVRGLDPSGGAFLGAGGQFSSNHRRYDLLQ